MISDYEYESPDWDKESEILIERAEEYAYQQLERDCQGIKAVNYNRPYWKYKPKSESKFDF